MAILSNVTSVSIVAAGNTALATLAASTASGGFSQLTNSSGFNSGAIFQPSAGGSASILEYTDRMCWNPINKTAMMLGGAHNNFGPSQNCNETSFVSYSETGNSWGQLPNVCPNFDQAFGGGIGHAYHHNAMHPSTGDFYHRQYASTAVMRFRHAQQSWQQVAPIAGLTGVAQVAGGLDYFPERDSMIYLDGDWGVWECTMAKILTGPWVQRASTNGGGFSPQLTGIGAYSNVCAYCPGAGAVFMGGGQGSSVMYRYTAAGTFSQRANAPVALGTPEGSGSGGSIFTSHPTLNRIMIWTGTGTGRMYNDSTNAWSTTGHNLPFAPTGTGQVSNIVCCPIPALGVILFAVYAGSNGQVWVYRP